MLLTFGELKYLFCHSVYSAGSTIVLFVVLPTHPPYTDQFISILTKICVIRIQRIQNMLFQLE